MRHTAEHNNRIELYFAFAILVALISIAFAVRPSHGQQPPPVPSFAQPQLSSNSLQLRQPSSNPLQFNQPVYMVRAWTPVRNVLGMQPLYRPWVQIAPAYNAQVIPVAPLGGGR